MAVTQRDLDWWHGLDKTWQRVFMLHLYYKDEIGMNYYKDEFFDKLNLDNLTDYQDILKVKALKHIDFQSWLGDYKIKDLSPLRELTQLEFLSLEEHWIEDLSPLAGLTSLRKLYLSRNRIKDFSVLEKLSLERLAVAENPLDGPFDLRLIAKHRRLRFLDASRCALKDLTPLRNLTELTDLYLAYNNIFDIAVMFRFTQLERLDLSHNHVFDISPLIHLHHLEDLNLSYNYNEFERLYLLETMQHLRTLSIQGNGINEETRVWLNRALPRCEIHFKDQSSAPI